MAQSPTQKIPHREVHEELTGLTRWLGWGCPTQYSTTFNDPEDSWFGRTVFWYECRKPDRSWLQINCSPIGQFQRFAAAVYALPFGLCSGFHRLPTGPPGGWTPQQVTTVRSFLARRHFTNAAARRRYRKAHPECAGFTWDRIQDLPHDV